MSDLAGRIDSQWETAFRYGPYFLMAVSVVAAAWTAELVDQGDRYGLITGLCIAAVVLHRVCVDRRWNHPLDDWLGASYLVLRIVIAFILTWINPFFALFAVATYFDADLYLSRRWADVALIVAAVTMAGSQSGGLPLDGAVQVGVFGALFAVNAALVLMFGRIMRQEAELASERTSTIDELERTNARLEQALAENARLQAELVARARESGVHDERERLALEIHDTLAQSLTGIVTQLRAADDAVEPDDARAHRARAGDLARDALGEARRSVQGLLPAQLDDRQLPEVLDRLVADWAGSSGVRGDLMVTGEPEAVHPDVGATVLRVAQEALTNVAKHAAASRVGVTLSYMDDELVLDVRDDGGGFDPSGPSAPQRTGGVGLRGMRQRAARVAGEIVVESEHGFGTAISLRVPYLSKQSTHE
ncbi:sensor histidine kinase [Aeromicrobium sp. CTD01-1L150]|uniref:sensor histidine kinase n=1 Tax=Aeromicrobium sp. CTD01-1L150 TaxID=3341830 RepID=UPI0035C0300B